MIGKYGLKIPDWHEILISQSGRCAACRDANPALQVDHCHETGRVRGLLCPSCNSALGYAKEDAARLAGLIEYLQANQNPAGTGGSAPAAA